MNDRFICALAAISGALAVIFGALGAHALKNSLEAAGNADSFDTAVLYHLTHSVAALVLAHAGLRKSAWTMLGGMLLFSGSIYLLSLDAGVAFLGPVTPFGGLILIVAWASAATAFFREPS